MADTQDVQEILLRVRSDKSTITSALRDLGQIKTGIKDLGNVSFNSLQSRIDTTMKEFADLRAEVKATADEIDGLGSGAGGAVGFSGRRAGESVGNIAALAGQFGGAETAAPIRAIADISRVSEALPQLVEQVVALGPAALIAAPALVGITLAVGEFTKELQAGKDALDKAIAADNAYYKAVTDLSSSQVKAEIDAKQRRNAVLKEQITEELRVTNQGAQDTVDNFSGIFDAVGLLFGSGTEQATKNIAIQGTTGSLIANLKLLNDEYAANETAIQRLTDGLKDGAFSANDFAAIQKAQMSEFIANAKVAADKQIELSRFERTASTQQLADRVASNNERLAGLKAEADALLSVSENSKEARDRLFEIQTETNNLTGENNLLNGSIGRSITTRENEKKAIDEATKSRADSISAWKKYSDDLIKINADEVQQLAALEQRYADTRIQLAKQAATAAENALAKLVEQRANLALSLSRAGADAEAQRQQDNLDSQIKFARDEARAARDHANELLDIRARAAADEEDLIAKRDFTGLLRSRKATSAAIDQSNKQYAQQRADRLEAFQQEADDRNRQFAFEAGQRLIKYQRDLQDAATQYQKERTAAEQNRRKALAEAFASYSRDQQLLRNKYQAERDARQQSITSELQQIQAGNAAKLALEQQYYIALENFLRAQLSNVANVGSNSFSGASSPGLSSVNYSPTFNISNATDANAVAKIVDRKNAQFFGALNK